MPRVISRYFGHVNSVIVYPEQPDIPAENLIPIFGTL